MKNKNHPSGYFFILEYVGDRKGRIVRNKDKDFFHGNVPVQIHIEFDFKLCFLYEIKQEKEEATFYRHKKSEDDFEEGSDYESNFTPDREPSFHVSYNNIILNQTSK
jgi:hypothetical protein